jgi:glycopeptide antibiotics resistance protein
LLFQVVGNVAAFVPLGFGVAGLQASSGKKIFVPAVLAGVVLSLIIETIQLGLPTRATDVDDVLFNTLGAALGAGLFLLARGRTPQRRRRSAGR